MPDLSSEANPAEPHSDLNIESYLEIVDEVNAIWRSLMSPSGISLTVTNKDVNAASAILAFSTHAMRLAPEIAAMLRRNLAWAATPLVRLCFECGITAQWVRHVPDGFDAVAKEAYRQRRAFIRAIECSTLSLDERFASLVQEPVPERLNAVPSAASGRNFEQRCLDLAPGGAEYYVMYRYLSNVAHAGPGLVDAYYDAEATSPSGLPAFVPYQGGGSGVVLAHMTATSVVWAGRALGMVIKKDKSLERFRNVLRSAARVLQLPAELRLSDDAWVRTSQPKHEKM